MIIINEPVEPKVSKATSTYPAVIVNVGSKMGSIVKLWFYCPATMPGEPGDARYAADNFVEAPVKPHEGIEYNYNIGGVIIISYSDGNLKTPQFVRYVEVSEEVRKINESYIKGNPIVIDGHFSLFDNVDLDSDIMVKAVSLLPALRRTASGYNQLTEDSYIYIDAGNGLFGKELRFVKFGRYGTELANNDLSKVIRKQPLDLEYSGVPYKPEISFLDFCSYCTQKTGGYNDTAYDIIDIFTAVCRNQGIEIRTNLGKETKNSLYLFETLAGLDDWESSTLINSAEYAKLEDKSKPKIELKTDIVPFDWSRILDSFYGPDNAITKFFREDFLPRFDSIYGKELDRYYSIVLHNNIYKIRSQASMTEHTNIAVLMLACIATALPILEHCIAEADTDCLNKLGGNYSKTLKEYLGYIKTDFINKDALYIVKDNYSIFFSDLVFAILERNTNNVPYGDTIQKAKNKIKNNINTGLTYILDNYDYYIGMWGSVLESSEINNPANGGDGEEGSTNPPTESTGQFLWPVPDYHSISSPFGPRKSGFHTGIDIPTNKKNGFTVVASDSGTVVTVADKGNRSYGKYIKIKHSTGYTTLYAHLQTFLVKEGDNVNKGQKIAFGDSTGNSTGPHLHFEIRDKSNSYLDPQKYL